MIEIDGVNNDGTHWGIGAAYTFDMITVGANYGSFDWDTGAFDPTPTATALSASYDFGGGLSAHLGYGWGERRLSTTPPPVRAATRPGYGLRFSAPAAPGPFGLNMSF
jgi:hypothetical protein